MTEIALIVAVFALVAVAGGLLALLWLLRRRPGPEQAALCEAVRLIRQEADERLRQAMKAYAAGRDQLPPEELAQEIVARIEGARAMREEREQVRQMYGDQGPPIPESRQWQDVQINGPHPVGAKEA